MITVKIVILCLVFCVSTYIGIMISNRYKRRTEQLCEMKRALNYFQAKIEYTYEPLQEIFFEISNNVNQGVGNIFKVAGVNMQEKSAKEAWEYSIDIAQTDFNNEDINVIKDFGKTLGQTDLQGQLSKTKLTLEFLDKQIKDAQEEESKNKKLYKTLGVLTGAGLVVILI